MERRGKERMVQERRGDKRSRVDRRGEEDRRKRSKRTKLENLS